MQRKFITNLAFLLFLNILVKPFWLLGIDRAVQNSVGAEAYGHYYALFNFSFLLNIVLDFGITNFNNRNIAQNRHLLNKHLSGIISLRIFLAFIFIIISTAFGLLIGYDITDLKLLWILLFNQILASFILYLRSNISGIQLFKTDSIISVLDRFIMILICSVLLWGNITDSKFKIEWFILAQTIAYLATTIFALIILFKRSKFTTLNFNKLFFLVILKKSYPFALLFLLMSFYNRIDSVMIERMLSDGKSQAGIYAQAYRLLDASNMIAYLFAGLLLPMFSHMLKQRTKIQPLLQLAFSLISSISLSAGIISIFYGNVIMELLYVEYTVESSAIFTVLMISFFAMSATYIYGTLLTANNNMKQLNIMAAFSMMSNIILNYYLIPQYQAFGASIASLITQYLAAFIQVFLCYKILKLNIDLNNIFRFFAFIVLAIGTCYTTSALIENGLIALTLSFLIMIIMAFITKMISLKAIYLIVKNDPID